MKLERNERPSSISSSPDSSKLSGVFLLACCCASLSLLCLLPVGELSQVVFSPLPIAHRPSSIGGDCRHILGTRTGTSLDGYRCEKRRRGQGQAALWLPLQHRDKKKALSVGRARAPFPVRPWSAIFVLPVVFRLRFSFSREPHCFASGFASFLLPFSSFISPVLHLFLRFSVVSSFSCDEIRSL